MKGLYRIAERNILIDSVYETVQKYCEEYKAFGSPDFSVKTSKDELENAEKRIALMIHKNDIPYADYSQEYIELFRVYKKIAERMPLYNTIMFHGSALAVDDVCYIFTAKSGTGKSTHSSFWRELLGPRAIMVNDDKPLIRVMEEKAIVYGTPWNGKHRLGNNIAVPLKSICFLYRAEVNDIWEISKTEAMPLLLQQVYRPRSLTAMKKTLDLIELLKIPFYHLECNRTIDAARLAYTRLKGK